MVDVLGDAGTCDWRYVDGVEGGVVASQGVGAKGAEGGDEVGSVGKPEEEEVMVGVMSGDGMYGSGKGCICADVSEDEV